MTKVFADTDITLDLLAKREPFYPAAARLFTLADEGNLEIGISALTMANVHYLLSKQVSSAGAKEILRRFKLLVTIVPFNEKILDLALNSSFSDFEDAIQYYSALQMEASVLITRNLKDYSKAEIPVMTASEFLSF